MTDDAPDVAPTERAPFAGVAVRDVVRDVVATMALLVALPMPWDVVHRGSDRLEIVLVTVVALLTIVAPYALRAGVLPPSWSGLTTARARVIGTAPYAVVALLYLLLDIVRQGEGGFGAGAALGLAGAVLAAAPRWEHGLTAAAGVVAVLALATPVIAAVDGDGVGAIVGAVLNALLVLGILWLTAVAFRRGDLAGGIVLVGVGAVIALELALLAGGSDQPWFESVHGQRFGLLLLPAVAAFAVPRVADQVAGAGPDMTVAGTVAGTATGTDRTYALGARWVAVAVRALDLVILVAAFVALVAVTGIVVDGPGVNLVLRLIVGVLMAVVAAIARRALVRDPRSGHTTAVGAACLVVVLGIVIVIARAGVGTRSNVEEMLVAFGLPAIVLAALLVPPSVRELIASPAPVDAPVAAPADGARPGPDAATVQLSGGYSGAPQGAWQEPTLPAGPASGTGAEWDGASQVRVQGQAGQAHEQQWSGSVQQAAGPESTQVMGPVGTPSAQGARNGALAEEPAAPEAGQARADSTQLLPPVADVPGSRWNAAQALDPTTPLADLALIVQEAPHLRPHVAANPSTYPALLDWLGALGDPAVDAALRARR